MIAPGIDSGGLMRTPWALVVAALIGAALAYSTPTKTDFSRSIWTPALAGVKAEWRERQQTPTGQAIRSFLTVITPTTPGLVPEFLDQAKLAELDRLPAFWQSHTVEQDLVIGSFFEYREESCTSSFLGIAGAIFALSDGCGVEPYRTKGGTGS